MKNLAHEKAPISDDRGYDIRVTKSARTLFVTLRNTPNHIFEVSRDEFETRVYYIGF
jgi:hypothetical protein